MDKHDTSDAETTYTQYPLNPGQERPYIIAKKYFKKAYVHLTVDDNEYIPNPKFNNISRILPYNIKINYLCGFYHKDKRTYESHKSKSYSESRSPKGLPRQLLCELLEELLYDKLRIEEDDIIVLDANPSYEPENFLVKMYESMGFRVAGTLCKTKEQYIKDGGEEEEYNDYFYTCETIMWSTVKRVREWCGKYYKN